MFRLILIDATILRLLVNLTMLTCNRQKTWNFRIVLMAGEKLRRLTPTTLISTRLTYINRLVIPKLLRYPIIIALRWNDRKKVRSALLKGPLLRTIVVPKKSLRFHGIGRMKLTRYITKCRAIKVRPTKECRIGILRSIRMNDLTGPWKI